MNKKTIKYSFEYLLLRLIAAFVRALPRERALALGRWLGRSGLRLLRQRRQLARENLRKAFPALSTAEIDRLLLAHFEHMGMNACEMLRLDMTSAGRSALAQQTLIEGGAYIRQAHAGGRGAIILSAHLGFWEIASVVMAELGLPLDIVAKPMKNSLAEDFFTRLRTRYGAEMLSSRKGARRILQSLRAGRVTGVLLDQHISPPGSVVVNFFGQPAWTTTAITSMAMKNSIPVVPVFCLRLADGRYRVRFEEPLQLQGSGAEAVAANTQLMTDIIERAVREDPAQWFWVHKRWRVKKSDQQRIKQSTDEPSGDSGTTGKVEE